MKACERGLTLLELLVLVAMVCILAAVAVPAYRDYTIRAKVSELIVAAAPYKASVADKAQREHTLAHAGDGLTVTPTGRISGGEVRDDGRIVVTGNDASVGAAVSLNFMPSLLPGGLVSWTCATNDSTQWKYVPPDCRK